MQVFYGVLVALCPVNHVFAGHCRIQFYRPWKMGEGGHMFRKALSTLKASAVLVTAALALFQIQGCGGGGGGDNTPNNPPLQKDTAKPTVVSTTPVQKGVAVGTNSAVSITFNEPIDSATLNSQTFTLKKDGTTAVTGSITTVGSTALFKLTDDLSIGTSYTATVTTGVKDLAGNALAADYTWEFTTPGSGTTTDTTPPTLLSTFPDANSTVVTLNFDVAVNFSEVIDPSTINPQTFTLMKNGTTPVTGTVTYVGTTALFKPASALVAGASYTATVTTGVKDLAGNPLAAYTWNFTTAGAAAPDTAPPQVLSQSVFPSNGATNVPVDSAYVVSFNEPVMPFEFGLIDGRPVAVTFNDTYTTVTMKPTVAMKPGTKYTASVKIRDMAGNQMPTVYTWEFTTSP